LIINRLSALDC